MDTTDDDGGPSTSSVDSKPKRNTIMDAFSKGQKYQKNDKILKNFNGRCHFLHWEGRNADVHGGKSGLSSLT